MEIVYVLTYKGIVMGVFGTYEKAETHAINCVFSDYAIKECVVQ